jgi:uncharacterized membrane protein YsdA (DUF1294 family)
MYPVSCRSLAINSESAYLLAAYVLMSALAVCLYWLDKQRAGRGEWRITERTLHAVELLGGWPGAWIAQRVFRHKWKKTRYMIVFWTIVGVHALAWMWWFGMLG